MRSLKTRNKLDREARQTPRGTVRYFRLACALKYLDRRMSRTHRILLCRHCVFITRADRLLPGAQAMVVFRGTEAECTRRFEGLSDGWRRSLRSAYATRGTNGVTTSFAPVVSKSGEPRT